MPPKTQQEPNLPLSCVIRFSRRRSDWREHQAHVQRILAYLIASRAGFQGANSGVPSRERCRTLALGALAHTWSLSIEEQFYFFWPVVISLLLSARNARSFRAVTVTGLLIGALVVSRFLLEGTGSVLVRYESTLARVDELMVGAF